MSIHNDLTGLGWLRKYLKSRRGNDEFGRAAVLCVVNLHRWVGCLCDRLQKFSARIAVTLPG